MFTKIFIALLMFLAAAANSQTLNILVPFAPGGGVDRSARHFQSFLTAKNITSVINYKLGANGIIGLTDSNTKPNTLVYTTVASVAEFVKTGNEVEYISATHKSAEVLITNKVSGVSTFKQFVEVGNGKSFGYGSLAHLNSINQLEKHNSSEYIKVPYKGAGEVVIGVANGTVDFAVIPYPVAKGLIQAQKLVPLAFTMPVSDYKTLPILENKYKNWTDISGYGFVMSKDSSNIEVAKWSLLISEYKASTEYSEFLSNEYSLPYKAGSTEFKKLVDWINK